MTFIRGGGSGLGTASPRGGQSPGPRPVGRGARRWSTIFCSLSKRADALELAHFVCAVKQDPVGMNFGLAVKIVRASSRRQPRFVGAVEFLHVEDEFIEIERIVVDLAQFDLPRADVRGVVEDVFQLVKVHERAFELVEIHLFDFRAARNIADEPRQRSAAMRARFIDQAAVNDNRRCGSAAPPCRARRAA